MYSTDVKELTSGQHVKPHSHIQDLGYDYADLANRPNLMFRGRYYANFAFFLFKEDCYSTTIRLTATESRLLLDMNTFVQDLSRM